MSGNIRLMNVFSETLRHLDINKRRRHVLKCKKHLESLNSLHSKYVLVPANKAANNVIVVCKKYYLEVVTNEITATTTYDPVARDKDIISDHLRCVYMSNNHITVKPELRCLPSFYWLPKLHKRPYGNRFIAASYRCTTKPLSKLLTSCLNTIITHFSSIATASIVRQV